MCMCIQMHMHMRMCMHVLHAHVHVQVEALRHAAAVNTAAAFSVHIDERLCSEIEFSKVRLDPAPCHPAPPELHPIARLQPCAP